MGKQVTSSLLGIVKEAAAYGDASAKTAASVGLQTEEWQKLAYAAGYAGVSTEELQTSMNRFNKVITAAASGSKNEAQIFKDLGVSLTDATGKIRPQQEIFKDVADVFSNLEEGAGKSSAQMLLFGRSGGKLASLLNSGKKGLEEMGEEAERMGLVFGGKKWEDLNDSLARVGRAFLGTKLQIAKPVVEISIAGQNVTADVSPYLSAITYTDRLEAESDDISVTFDDVQNLW